MKTSNDLIKMIDLPSPKGHFLLGHLSEYSKNVNKHQVVERWVEECGNLFKIHFAGTKFIVSADPHVNHEILSARPDKFRRLAKMIEVIEEMGVKGVFNSEGESWRILYQLFNPVKMINVKFICQLLFVILFLFPPFLSAQDNPKIPAVSAKTLERWMNELSNWGRWGENDEMGTLNLISPEKRVQAAALVSEGKTISLAFNLSKNPGINNGDPLIHELVASEQWAGDTYTINYHGYAHSHLDALCHIASGGKLYNGFSEKSRKQTGVDKLGIENMHEGIFTRGILIDIPWLKGVPYLEPATAIFAGDLDQWEEKTGVKVESGDVLLIRTGRWQCEKENGPWKYSEKAAGLHASAVKWLKSRDISALGSDGASDVLPSGVEGQTHPVHLLVLMSLGTPILDNLNLEELAKKVADSQKWEFLFVGSPLRVKGGTGSPLNPLAIF